MRRSRETKFVGRSIQESLTEGKDAYGKNPMEKEERSLEGDFDAPTPVREIGEVQPSVLIATTLRGGG